MSAAIVSSTDPMPLIYEKIIPEKDGILYRLHLQLSRLVRKEEEHVQNHVRKSLKSNEFYSIVRKNYFTERVIYVTHWAFIREISKQTGDLLENKFLEMIANTQRQNLKNQSFSNNLRKSQHGKFLNPLTDLAAESIKNYHLNMIDRADTESLIRKYVISAILENFIGYSIAEQPEDCIEDLLGRIDEIYQVYKKSPTIEEFKAATFSKAKRVLSHLLRSEGLIEELKRQFEETQLVDFLQDLFSVCTGILSNWLLSSLKCLAEYKEVWLQDLTEEVFNKEHTITQNLNYHHLEAFLNEVWRLYTPIGQNKIITSKAITFHILQTKESRSNRQIEKYDKYSIPPNSKVVLLYSLSHIEEKFWKNPSEFNPCRFIEDENLKEQLHFFAKDSNGANLAKMIVMIYMIEFLKSTENLRLDVHEKSGEKSFDLKFDLRDRSFFYERGIFKPLRFKKKGKN